MKWFFIKFNFLDIRKELFKILWSKKTIFSLKCLLTLCYYVRRAFLCAINRKWAGFSSKMFCFLVAWENNVAKFNLILNEAQALTTNLQNNDEVLSMNFNWWAFLYTMGCRFLYFFVWPFSPWNEEIFFCLTTNKNVFFSLFDYFCVQFICCTVKPRKRRFRCAIKLLFFAGFFFFIVWMEWKLENSTRCRWKLNFHFSVFFAIPFNAFINS